MFAALRCRGVRGSEPIDLEAVSRAIRYAESQEIAPRFRRLRDGDVEEKSPGEVVTAADRGCEEMLTSLLREIRVAVVGEEAAAADPVLVDLIGSSPEVWLVDPLDGTSNFAAGSTDYSVMVAYLRNGLPVACWMWNPSTSEMFVAERGSGSYANGVRVHGTPPTASLSQLEGVVRQRFLPEDIKTRVLGNEGRFGSYLPGQNCAGVEYPASSPATSTLCRIGGRCHGTTHQALSTPKKPASARSDQTAADTGAARTETASTSPTETTAKPSAPRSSNDRRTHSGGAAAAPKKVCHALITVATDVWSR